MTVLAESPSLALDRPPGHPDEFVGRAITPAEQVRTLLARKKRQQITDWERVWPWAVGRVRWPHDREERHEWKDTIVWAEPAFRAAYEGAVPLVDMSALSVELSARLALSTALRRFD
jgi:hypothetical protein